MYFPIYPKIILPFVKNLNKSTKISNETNVYIAKQRKTINQLFTTPFS